MALGRENNRRAGVGREQKEDGCRDGGILGTGINPSYIKSLILEKYFKMEIIKIFAAPALMIIGGIITWIIKTRTEEYRVIQSQLREQQRQIYQEILTPLIKMLGGTKTEKDEKEAIKKILSFDYRKTAFEMNMIGSDDVVKAWGDFMQYFYKNDEAARLNNPYKSLEMLGKVILEIRKSLGHKKTKLTPMDMLRFIITDIDSLK